MERNIPQAANGWTLTTNRLMLGLCPVPIGFERSCTSGSVHTETSKGGLGQGFLGAPGYPTPVSYVSGLLRGYRLKHHYFAARACDPGSTLALPAHHVAVISPDALPGHPHHA